MKRLVFALSLVLQPALAAAQGMAWLAGGPDQSIPFNNHGLLGWVNWTNGCVLQYQTGTAIGATNGYPVCLTTLPPGATRFFDVTAYGAKGDGTTDDTAAFAATIVAVNASAAAGQSACLQLPRGNFFINGATLPPFTPNTAAGVCGAGAWKSIIKLGSSYTGDLFSWSDAWSANAYNATFSAVVLPQKLGPRATGFTVIGNRATVAQQNALMFYDHNDYVFVDDVDIEMLTGRALGAGIIKYDTDAYLRESRISNFRAVGAGLSSIPAIEIASQCTSGCTGADASNTIDISHVDVLAPVGPGVVVSNSGPSTGGTARMIHFVQLRVEGSTNIGGTTTISTDDLFRIGGAAQSGSIKDITCVDCAFVAAPTGKSHIAITGANASTAPFGVSISGQIDGGSPSSGKGMTIAAGQNIIANFLSMYSGDTNITVASSATTAGPIIINGNGLETGYSWAVDSSAAPYVGNGHGVWGVPGSATQYIAPYWGQSDYVSGNPRGVNSVDLQTSRFDPLQVANGAAATISGGEANRASADDTTVCGGSLNIAAGYRSTACGGYNNSVSGQYSFGSGNSSNDQAWIGVSIFGGGQFATQGDNQTLNGILHAVTTSTSATRLTADGLAAVALNIWAFAANYGASFDLRCQYYDAISGARRNWLFRNVLISRGASAAATTLSAPSATDSQTTGSTTAAAPTLSADTTLGGLTVSVTAPNSDLSHWQCALSGLVGG